MRRILSIALLAALAACSKDKDPDQPAKLSAYTQTFEASRVWSASVGGTKVPLRLGLELASQGGQVYAAGEKGVISAFDVKTGKRTWETRTKLALGGGVSVDGNRLVAGSTDGDVIELDATSGKELWRVNVASEILSTPALSSKIVVVRSVDGRLHGLSTDDGHELWQQQQTVPKLSLRGAAAPVLAGDVAVTGFDNGRVVATNLIDGSSAWEQQLQVPQGKTELERLVDIDSVAQVSGNDIFIAGFQGKVAMLQLDSGQTWWSHDASSYRSLALGNDAVYMTTAEGDVVALQRRTGTELWRQKHLEHRGLSGPAVYGDTLVVADYKGYVHWLDRRTGDIVERERAGKSRFTNPPLVVDDLVLLIDDRGEISAWRAKGLASPRQRKK